MKTRSISILALVGLLAGCNREDLAIREQHAPKQQLVMASASGMELAEAAQAAEPAAGAQEIQWTVPDGWKTLPPSAIRLASFQVSETPDVQVSVIPLSGASGGLLANVNRWEVQLTLPPTPEKDLPKILKHADVSGSAVDMVDLMGPATAKPQLRMLGAILPHGERTYYFKLVGPADIVGAQKDKFEAFIKSIKFVAGGKAPEIGDLPPMPGDMQNLPAGHPQVGGGAPGELPAGHPQIGAQAPAMPQPAEAGAADITYSVPNGWVKDPPMQFRLVSFHVGENAQRVDVIVSRLPATGSGSPIDNINRWRGQVGLPPSKEGEPQLNQPVKVDGADGSQFDFTGPGAAAQAKRIIVAWVPKGTDWWFFRVSGPSSLVTQQQAGFDNFLKSVKFSAPKP